MAASRASAPRPRCWPSAPAGRPRAAGDGGTDGGDAIREAELARELLDGRSPALTGTLIACIAALFVALLGWLAWAQVDEVVHATGTVEPAGRVKIVNHPHGGRVAEIHVREGDQVAAGQLLVTLDGEVARSERSELLGRLAAAHDRGGPARGRGGRARAGLGLGRLSRPICLAAQRALLEARNAAQASRRESLAKAVQTRRGELRTAAAEVGRLRNSLALLKQQREAVRALAERGLYPELKLVRSSGSTATISASSPRPRRRWKRRRRRWPRPRAGWRAWRPSGAPRCWRQLAQATAERDRLGEQLRAQEAILAGLVVQAPAAGHRPGDRGHRARARRWRRTRP